MRKAVAFFAVAGCVLCGACNLIGIVGSKSYYEQKVPAEFLLKDVAEGGVLIFVDETGAGRAELELRPGLTEAVGAFLVKKARIKNEYLVSHDSLSQLRGEREGHRSPGGVPARRDFASLKISQGSRFRVAQVFSSLSPVQLGGAAGAAVVLYVLITDYGLYAMGEQEYYGGSLVTRSILFDVASGRALWPREGAGRVVKTRVELETGGRAATLNRLIMATAHCITRSFYDCRRPEFRTADEQRYSFQEW